MSDETRVAQALERISLVLGAMLASKMNDLDLGTKASLLARLGFQHREIAALLNSTERSITVSIHNRRKKGASPKSRRRR